MDRPARAHPTGGWRRRCGSGSPAGEWPDETEVALRARLIRAALHGLMAQWHLAPSTVEWEAATQALTCW
jgi:hypothetical protein